MDSNTPPVFRHRFRVRYAEVDSQSVVFNSRYLEYADLVITEYWRACGLHFAGEEALEFHVVRAEVDFVQPIRGDEMIEGRAWTTRIGTSSVTTLIELHGDPEHGAGPAQDMRARINLVHVHADLTSRRPLAVPDPARRALAASEEKLNG